MPVVIEHGKELPALLRASELAGVRTTDELQRILDKEGSVKLNVNERLTFNLDDDRRVSVGHTGGKRDYMVTTEARPLEPGNTIKLTPEFGARVINGPNGDIELHVYKESNPKTRDKSAKTESSVDSILAEADEILGKVVDIPNLEDRIGIYRAWINKRVAHLTDNSEPIPLNPMFGTTHEGFIHPDSDVRRGITLPALHVNDNDAYIELFDTLRDFKKSWGDTPLRKYVAHAITTAVGRYYGSIFSDPDVKQKNMAFYCEREEVSKQPIDLRELKAKGIAVCVERAALAQNYLALLGYDSTFAMGDCDIGGIESHAYNIVHRGKNHAIYDATHPSAVQDEKGKLLAVLAFSSPITDDQYLNLLDGGSVEVPHMDYIENEGKRTPNNLRKYRYQISQIPKSNNNIKEW